MGGPAKGEGMFAEPVEVVNPGSASEAVPVQGAPGAIIQTAGDVEILAGTTAPLPPPPTGTRRMRVYVTVGDTTTQVRIREVGGLAGSGVPLSLGDSTLYGGGDGSIAALEAQNVAGPIARVGVQYER